MTIGKRLILSFSVLIALTLILSGGCFVVIGMLNGEIDRTVHRTGKSVELIGDLARHLTEIESAETGYILFSSLSDASQTENHRRKFQESAAGVERAITELRPLVTDADSVNALQSLERGYATLNGAFSQMMKFCAEQQCNKALDLHVQSALPVSAELERDAARLIEKQRGLQAADAERASATSSRSQWLIVLMFILSAAVGVIVHLVLRTVNQRLTHFAERLMSAAQKVLNASSQVSSSSQSLAQGTSEQAASLEETSATTEEISAMTAQNAQKTAAAAEMVVQSDHRIADANRRLETMQSSMQEITASSGKISKIIKVIDEIAFQTNILALNAAVEAARAGEAGMGFAVVAEEVRNLAQRSSDAARDTAGLIEESIGRSNEGSHNLEEVSAAIRGITESAGKIRQLVEEVNVSSREQAQGAAQVTAAVAQMSQVTQQTAAGAEESASAGAELSSQAGALNEMASELMRLVRSDREMV
jgi:methyl-accepting chemotaxis protein